MTYTEIIEQFTNKEDGIVSFITIGHLGFHVSLEDLDSCEFFDSVKCFVEKDEAIADAKKIVGINE